MSSHAPSPICPIFLVRLTVIKRVSLTTQTATATGKTFDITYEITREKAIGLGTVTFTIDKFESSLMGFSFCQQLLLSVVQPASTEGVTRTKKALQHMINLEAKEYYLDCIKSLRNLIHPEIIQSYWEDVFSYLGPLEGEDVLNRSEKHVLPTPLTVFHRNDRRGYGTVSV